MHNSKPVTLPLARHFKLSKKNCPIDESDIKQMEIVLCANQQDQLCILWFAQGLMWPILLVHLVDLWLIQDVNIGLF